MNRRQRIAAALRGDPVDRPPISLWRHFPHVDRTVDGLVNATLAFQRDYDSDFVKLMPTGMYQTLDYGAEIRVVAGEGGTTELVSGPIASAADWRRLGRLDPRAGALGEQVEVVRRVRAALGADTPIVQTIFSPLTIAHKLAPGRLKAHLVADPAAVEAALTAMTAWSIEFARECLAAGCDGFFFATQLASSTMAPRDQYQRWGETFDRQILASLDERAWFNLVHAHGEGSYFDRLATYPVQAINWHDRETEPTLRAALTLTDKCLIAGIHRNGVIRHGSVAETRAEIREAIEQTGGRRHIIAPGCVLPTGAPAANLSAARLAVAE